MTDTILDPKVDQALNVNNIEYKILECDPDLADTAAFCEHYNFKPEQAANTILVTSKKVEPVKYAVCVVLATTKLDVNKKVCQLLEVKRGSFADAETTISQTGMMIGGVTAIGIANLPIYVDAAVMEQQEVVMGGGNRSSKVLLDPNELKKLPLLEVVDGLALPRE
jgi:prolyl-tRNA editing enzyme YbaK/EbsC (Cys-tRNA(Pro) deacylase)